MGCLLENLGFGMGLRLDLGAWVLGGRLGWSRRGSAAGRGCGWSSDWVGSAGNGLGRAWRIQEAGLGIHGLQLLNPQLS